MIFEIEPHKSVGKIKFGMNREQVRALFSNQPKVVYSLDLCDIFHALGLQIFYKYEFPHLCQAVMLEEPAEVSVLSYKLLGGNSIKDFKEIFESLGFSVSVYTEGIEVNDLGIFLSTQDYEIFGNEPPESVVAFIEGYYSNLDNKTRS